MNRRIAFLGDRYSWGNSLLELDYVKPLAKHFTIQIVDPYDSDYLFVNETPRSLREYHKFYSEKKIGIFVSGEALVPDFNLFDYALGFDLLDFEDRYLRFEPGYRFKHHFEGVYQPDYDYQEKYFCDFIYSNFRANSNRKQLKEFLETIGSVKSYGGYLNNVETSSTIGRYDKNWIGRKIEIQSRHLFSIAAENAFHYGYTSEKVFSSFAAGNIPIYWGNPMIARDVNPNRIINVHDFDDFDSLGHRITFLMENLDEYIRVLQQKWFTEMQEKSILEYPLRLESFLLNIFSMTSDCAIRKGSGTTNLDYFVTISRGYSTGRFGLLIFKLRQIEHLRPRLLNLGRRLVVRFKTIKNRYNK